MTCKGDPCSANQIQRMDGFCLQCGDGAVPSADGKSCERAAKCTGKEF